MADDVPEIPGYYYDPSRKKYFRILPNHLAPRNTSSFYTRNTIADLKASGQSLAHETKKASIAASHAHRHHRTNPFLRITLFRELGTAGPSPQICEAVRETYARSLCREKSLESGFNAAEGVRCFAVTRGMRGLGMESIWQRRSIWRGKNCPEVDAQSEGSEDAMESLIVAVGAGSGNVRFSRYLVDTDNGELVLSDDRAINWHIQTDPITSLTFTAEGNILGSTLGGHNTPLMSLMHLPGTSACRPFNPSHSMFANRSGSDIEHIHHPTRSIWCSTTNRPASTSGSSSAIHYYTNPDPPPPPSQSTDFAIGTSSGVIILSPRPSGYTALVYRVPSDVFSVSYLPQPTTTHSFTLFSGSRDGGIRLHLPPTHDGSCLSTPIIHHGSIISHLHPLPHSPHLLLAKGPQKIALYDLRYPHPSSPSKSFSEPTRPVLVYDELSNIGGFRVDEGWDVSADGGVMAGVVSGPSMSVASSTFSGSLGAGTGVGGIGGGSSNSGKDFGEIGLWSVQTGKRLRFSGRDGGTTAASPQEQGKKTGEASQTNQIQSRNYARWFTNEIPKCIKFVDVPGLGEEVWAGVGNRIERFGLGEGGDGL